MRKNNQLLLHKWLGILALKMDELYLDSARQCMRSKSWGKNEKTPLLFPSWLRRIPKSVNRRPSWEELWAKFLWLVNIPKSLLFKMSRETSSPKETPDKDIDGGVKSQQKTRTSKMWHLPSSCNQLTFAVLSIIDQVSVQVTGSKLGNNVVPLSEMPEISRQKVTRPLPLICRVQGNWQFFFSENCVFCIWETTKDSPPASNCQCSSLNTQAHGQSFDPQFLHVLRK